MNAVQEMFARSHYSEPECAFVIMPFRGDFDRIYRNHIRPAVEACGMRCVRADEVYSTKTIMGDIWEGLQRAEVVIADLTTRNPNVMYELGLSHAIWRKTILLAQSMDDVPFDLKSLRIIVYDPNSLDTLSFQLSAAIEALKREPGADPDIASKAQFERQHVYCSNDLSNSEYNWRFWVNRTRHELVILGGTLRKWFGDSDARNQLGALIRRGIKVSVFLSDWEPMRAFGGTGVADLYQSACDVVQLKQSLPDHYKGFFADHFHNAVSTLSGVFSDPEDDDGMLVLTPRFATQHNSETRLFVILERNKHTNVFNSLKNELFMFRNIGTRKTAEQMKAEYEANDPSLAP